MKKNTTVYTLSFMAAICIVFGSGIAIVNYSTQSLLEENEKLHRNQIICNAFLLEVPEQSSRAYQECIDKNITFDSLTDTTRTIPLFFCSKDSSIGFIFSGFGFWDLITGIMVLTPDLSTIKNIQFFDQKETPGLGARIEEKWFTDQFKGLHISWDAPVSERIIIGVSSEPDATNRVDAITGASQTSLALMKTMNSELETFITLYNRIKASKVGKSKV